MTARPEAVVRGRASTTTIPGVLLGLGALGPPLVAPHRGGGQQRAVATWEAERGGPAGGVALLEPAVGEPGDEPAAGPRPQARTGLLAEQVEGDGDRGTVDGEPVGLVDRAVDGERDEPAPRATAHGHLGDGRIGVDAVLPILGAMLLLPGGQHGLAAGLVKRELDEPLGVVLQHDRVADQAREVGEHAGRALAAEHDLDEAVLQLVGAAQQRELAVEQHAVDRLRHLDEPQLAMERDHGQLARRRRRRSACAVGRGRRSSRARSRGRWRPPSRAPRRTAAGPWAPCRRRSRWRARARRRAGDRTGRRRRARAPSARGAPGRPCRRRPRAGPCAAQGARAPPRP